MMRLQNSVEDAVFGFVTIIWMERSMNAEVENKMMLTEDEIKIEIETIRGKITRYENDIKPFSDLEDLLKKRIALRHTGIGFNITISQKNAKVAMIKNWKKEIQILQRVLSGQKMPTLTDELPNFLEQVDVVKNVIRDLRSENNEN